MRFLLLILLSIFFYPVLAQESSLPFQNLQQVNPAYAGTEGDFSAKVGALYNLYNFGDNRGISLAYASVDGNLSSLNSGIGVTGTFENWNYGQHNTLGVNYNYKVSIAEKYKLGFGAALKYKYITSTWSDLVGDPEPRYNTNIHFNPGVWLSSDSGKFSLGVSITELFQLYNSYNNPFNFWPKLRAIAQYNLKISDELDFRPTLMYMHRFSQRERRLYFGSINSVSIAADFTINKAFHVGLYGDTFRELLASNLGYTFKDKLRLSVSTTIISRSRFDDSIEAMLALKI